MKLDLAFHGDPAKVGAVAAEADGRGIGGVFVAELSNDPYLTLTLAAGASERIEVGTSIAVAFARSPMTTAISAWDVQRYSGGRLILGLGTQIKPHITRRYAMPWSDPADRMAEYVAALRAIWSAFSTGDKLDFRGDYYEHTLLPPLFNPGPVPGGAPPVWLAAVGPRMLATAASVADGLICHPLLSRSYLEDVVVPAVANADPGFTLATLCMVATGRTEEEIAAATRGVRQQIGFYASTPAYKAVLDHHGWGDLHAEAHRFTKTDRWEELADLVDDEVLSAFAVVGDLDTARDGLRERFAGIAQRTCPSMPYNADDRLGLDLVSD